MASQIDLRYEHARAYEGRADYAAAHAVSLVMLDKARWEETVYQGRPALTFPTASGQRWRFLDGQQPHYKSQKGYKRCWYGLNQHTTGLLADNQPLVIANGEIAVLAAQEHGLAAACVTNGEKALDDRLIQHLQTFLQYLDAPRIWIALDCDAKGRKVALAMQTQLSDAGIETRALELGLSEGGDLADFCLHHGEKTVEALQALPDLKASALNASDRRWKIVHASELEELPPVSWLIPGELPDRALTVVYGASGVGKSFFALDYALRVAQSQTVIYMAGEGVYGYQGRIQAWCQHYNLSVGQLFMCLGAVAFLDKNDLDAFIEKARETAPSPKLIVVDTLARSMLGADENSSRDMGKFVQACEEVKQEFDCAVLLVHHTNKSGVSERGSGALRGGADAMIKLTDEDEIIRVESVKTKDAQPFEARFVKLLPVDIGERDPEGHPIMPPVVIEAEQVADDPNGPLTARQRKVIEAMALEALEDGTTAAELVIMTDIPERTLYRVLSKLKKRKLVMHPGKGAPFKLTAQGLALAGRTDAFASEADLETRSDSIFARGKKVTASASATVLPETPLDDFEVPAISDEELYGMTEAEMATWEADQAFWEAQSALAADGASGSARSATSAKDDGKTDKVGARGKSGRRDKTTAFKGAMEEGEPHGR